MYTTADGIGPGFTNVQHMGDARLLVPARATAAAGWARAAAGWARVVAGSAKPVAAARATTAAGSARAATETAARRRRKSLSECSGP